MNMTQAQRFENIWNSVREIPSGQVASYGQIAEIAGIPRGARQVGSALRHLPSDRAVPWHRVLQVSGRIAFEKGSEKFEEQKGRLIKEGVVIPGSKVDMRKYRWEPDLDEFLWKPRGAWDEE
jgi:methylated-DNA-protein-cysteine methyltransferase-like protein